MVIAWMLYCIAVSALLGLGALALERALGALRLPTRWPWMGAILLSTALPFAEDPTLGIRARLVPPGPPPPWSSTPGVGPLSPAEPVIEGPAAPRMADLLLLPGWLVASLLLFLATAGLLLALHLRRRWRRETVAGARVLVSPGTGPAVIGFLRSEVVLPEWVLGWDEPRLRMVVEHEREHIRARDPLLLLAALLAVLLVPWNAATWWQIRRLRLAMEVDCDARVLRGAPDAHGYGALLLEVARLASTSRIPIPALTEPRSFLESRIRAIASLKAGRRLRAAALYAAACLAALVSIPAIPPVYGGYWDFSVAAAQDDPLPGRQGGVLELSQVTVRSRLTNADGVARLLRERYPPLLRAAGVTGSALAVAREAYFIPARRNGEIVAVRLQLPVVFTLRGEAGIVDPTVRVSVGLGRAADLQDLDARPELLNDQELRQALQAAYPPLLRGAGVTGTTIVAFVITPQGTVGAAEAVEASRPEFGAAALRAIRQARFSPGVRAGRAVPVRVSMSVSFLPDAPGDRRPSPGSL